MSTDEERRTARLDTKRIREMASFIANEKRRRKEPPGAVLTGTVPGLCDEVDYLRNLLEQRTAALTRTIDAKNAAEAKVTRVESLLWKIEQQYPLVASPRIEIQDIRAALDGGQP